jgi:soluble lytic murein transglycosylase
MLWMLLYRKFPICSSKTKPIPRYHRLQPSVLTMPIMGTAIRKRKKQNYFIPRLFLVGLLGATGYACIAFLKILLSGGTDFANRLDSPVLKLASTQANERAGILSDIVVQGGDAVNVSRAKYVLANDLIQQDQGSKALRYLDNLEKDYPLLASYILWKRALAYELIGDRTAVDRNLNELATKYPESPVSVEALERLGKRDAHMWEKALQKFPHHPRTLSVLQNMMEKSPRNTELMFSYLRSGGTRFAKGVELADKLSTEYMPILKPADWRLLAEAYLQNNLFNRAAFPLSRSPVTAENLLLIGQTARQNKNVPLAKTTYQELIGKFQEAPEADRALLELSEMSLNDGEALTYLDKLERRNNPDLSPTALFRKMKLLEKAKVTGKTQAISDEIIKRFPQSEAAAGMRWEQAQAAATQQDYAKAWRVAKSIVTDSPDNRYSARAAFWIGKWAGKMGRTEEAKQAFTYTIVKYTQSYYGWRAASSLGWDVSDFKNLRTSEPKIEKVQANQPLPVGSKTLRELYQIGAYRDSWTLWQNEFPDREKYSVNEQFAEGSIRRGLEQYQLALARVSQLEKRESVTDKEQHQKLRQSPDYWHALYPLAYSDFIQTVAQKRKISPLLVLSIVRQESKFDPETQSPVGALGLMQVMPTTANFVAAKIEMSPFDLRSPPDNIKIGTWYLAHLHDEVKNDSLLAIASYNAGPGNVNKWLKTISYDDPDEFIENIPFDETQGYVRNVIGNYWNYLRTYNPEISKKISTLFSEYKQ